MDAQTKNQGRKELRLVRERAVERRSQSGSGPVLKEFSRMPGDAAVPGASQFDLKPDFLEPAVGRRDERCA